MIDETLPNIAALISATEPSREPTLISADTCITNAPAAIALHLTNDYNLRDLCRASRRAKLNRTQRNRRML